MWLKWWECACSVTWFSVASPILSSSLKKRETSEIERWFAENGQLPNFVPRFSYLTALGRWETLGGTRVSFLQVPEHKLRKPLRKTKAIKDWKQKQLQIKNNPKWPKIQSFPVPAERSKITYRTKNAWIENLTRPQVSAIFYREMNKCETESNVVKRELLNAQWLI